MAASFAALLAFAIDNVAIAAEKAQPQSGKQPTLLAQNTTVKKSKAGKSRLNVDKNGVILKGYDPVAYFRQGKAVKGSAAHSSSFGGATYYFASAADKAEFDKDPAKFQPQYGGWCARSMARGKVADIDPNAFAIFQNKLYVCTTPASAAEFKSNAAKEVPAADDHWRQLYEG
jgi:YHS domain-containing protein